MTPTQYRTALRRIETHEQHLATEFARFLRLMDDEIRTSAELGVPSTVSPSRYLAADILYRVLCFGSYADRLRILMGGDPINDLVIRIAQVGGFTDDDGRFHEVPQ